MSDFSELNFTAEDLKSPGWATSILLKAFRNLPEGLSLSVLSHIDSMVEEGANDMLRTMTGVATATLSDSLQSDDVGEQHLAMLAIDSALWKFAYEFNGFVELYEKARSSLIDQQFGVLAQLSMGAMERLRSLEMILPDSMPQSLASMMEMLSTNKVVSSFFQEFHSHLSGIASLSQEIEDYSVESAHYIRDFVRERFSFSGWFTLAQSALDPAREQKPSSNKSLSI